MACRPATWQSSVALMCETLAGEGILMGKTISHYRTDCSAVVRILESAGRETLPWKIGEDDARWLLRKMQSMNLTVSTRRGYVCALKRLTLFYGSNPFLGVKILWPHDERPNARWLSPDDVRRLLALRKTPLEEFVVHCELCLGMRRIELLRLTTASFTGTYVDVLGKGHAGGKPRRIPYHRDTAEVYSRYLAHRERLVASVVSKRPGTAVPDDLLVWVAKNQIHTYGAKGTGLDKIVSGLGKRIGKTVSHHDLRRTFGRALFKSGVAISIIQKILGHDSPVTTTKYLGIDMDDMDSAMKMLCY